MVRLRKLLEALRTGLWFVPTLLALGLLGLAVALIEAERLAPGAMEGRWPRLFGAGPQGARALLAAVATSLITVVGITFSTTIVALALASNQYTSRVLRHFMRDRENQVVLGLFSGIFVYCIVVLRTIRGPGEASFVPALAVLVAVVLALVAIFLLIFFIHHIAVSIQATHLIAASAAETHAVVERLFPNDLVGDSDEDERDPGHTGEDTHVWIAVPARRSGYIQGVDRGALVALACAHGTIFRMERAVGEFVIEACPLASVADRQPGPELVRKLNAAFLLGHERTMAEDVSYGLRQLVDVALKALSPAINDSTTAIQCVDALGDILARLASRRVAPRALLEGGKVRVLPRGPTFSDLLDLAFEQIRQNAGANVAVLARLLQLLELLEARTSARPRIQALRAHAVLVTATADRTIPMAQDRALIPRTRASRSR